VERVKAASRGRRDPCDLTSPRLVTPGRVSCRSFVFIAGVAAFLALTAQQDQNTPGQDKHEQEEKYGRHYEKEIRLEVIKSMVFVI